MYINYVRKVLCVHIKGVIFMSQVSTVDARKDLSTVINRAAFGKERIVLTRREKPVVAVVPLEDLNLLEKLDMPQTRKTGRNKKG